MFAQYFGQYLLNRGLVSANELDRAMTAQKDTRVKLGVLAINHGFMSDIQVEAVHQAQTKIDKKFGEIAIELGYVTEEQITTLLNSQQNAHLALGQALIDQQILTYSTFSEALSQYKEAYSLSDEQFESITNGSIDTLLEVVLQQSNIPAKGRLADYIRLFAKNVIRFIDSDIRMEVSSSKDFSAYEWAAYQPLVQSDRSSSRMTALGGSEASFLQFASLYAQEVVDEPGEMMEASVGEFLNLHNGIYLVNLSNEGTELELEPQIVCPGSDFSTSSPIKALIHIHSQRFSIDLLITDLKELA
jgi:hypothetical protein